MAEETVPIELAGRTMQVRKPSEGAIVVLTRLSRGLGAMPTEGAGQDLTPEQRAKLLRSVGALGTVLDQMLVDSADQEWLDDALISGEVDPQEAFALIGRAAQAFNIQAQPVAKAPAARRRRG
jgi:hypothetical protein